MSMFDDLPAREILDGNWSGKIATNVSSVDDPVYVTINSFGKTHRFGPCRWVTRGTSLPNRGDVCLVTFDENQRAYVIAWWDGTLGGGGGGGEVGPGDIGTTELADNAVTKPKMADNSVSAAEIENDTVTHNEIAVANKDGAAATPSLRTLGTGSAQAAAGNDARLSDSRIPTAHGDSLHDATVASLSSGIVPNAELGSGTPDSTKFLRGDRIWAVPAGGGDFPIIDVKADFGAVGDGSTDDYDAWQDAFDAIPAAGGAILAPPGPYLINSGTGFTIKPYTTIIGTSYPRYYSAVEPVSNCYLKIGAGFTGSSLWAPPGTIRNVSWQNIGLFGMGLGTPGSGGKHCIRFPDLADVTGEMGISFENVHIAGWTGSGVCGRLHVGSFVNCHISNCGYWCIETITGTNNRWNDVKFLGGFLYYGRSGCLAFDGGTTTANIGFIETRFERGGNQPGSPLSPYNTDAPGVLLGNAEWIRFIGTNTDGNTGHGYHLRRTAADSKRVRGIEFTSTHQGRDGGGDQSTLPTRASIACLGFNGSNRVEQIRVNGGKNVAGKADDGGGGIVSPKHGVMLDYVYDAVFNEYDAEEATFGSTIANRWNIGAGGISQLWRTRVNDQRAGIFSFPSLGSGTPPIVADGSGEFTQLWYDESTNKIMVREGGSNFGVVVA